MNTKENRVKNIYQLEGRVPLMNAVPFGLQHVLAKFVANIAPIIIVAGAGGLSPGQSAVLIQTAMIIAGIGTLIQLYPLWKIGSGLPIVMGISFTFVSVFCFIGGKYGYHAIIGAIIVGGIIEGTIGLFARYWKKLITPVGASSFGGGSASVTVVALSLSMGIGFTQVPQIFSHFPRIISIVFAENCVTLNIISVEGSEGH